MMHAAPMPLGYRQYSHAANIANIARPSGLQGTGLQITTSSVQAAGSIVTAGITSGAIAISAGWIPVIGAGVVGVTLALNAIFNRKSAKQKVAATKMVEQIEPQLAKNRDEYFAGPRTRESQAGALANFDYAWNWLISAEACGNAQLGDAGKRCISERSPGGKYSWFSYYRDPIADDPGVRDVAVTIPTAALDSLNLTPEQKQMAQWMLPAGALLLGVIAITS